MKATDAAPASTHEQQVLRLARTRTLLRARDLMIPRSQMDVIDIAEPPEAPDLSADVPPPVSGRASWTP